MPNNCGIISHVVRRDYITQLNDYNVNDRVLALWIELKQRNAYIIVSVFQKPVVSKLLIDQF